MKYLQLSLFSLGAFSLVTTEMAATLSFDASSDYDNNFQEYLNPSVTSWSSDHGGSLEKGGGNSATVAIYNTTATGGSAGSGGTGAATPNNNTFSNFTLRLDFSTPELITGGDSAGIFTKVSADATSGYLVVFRLLSSGTADFRVWDSVGTNPSTGSFGSPVSTQSFTVPASSFAINTFYTFQLTVADVGSNVQFTGAIFAQGGGAEIGNTLTYTDTSSALIGPGQIGFRFGSATTTPTAYDNITITPTPEPATVALLGFAGLGLASRRRRSK